MTATGLSHTVTLTEMAPMRTQSLVAALVLLVTACGDDVSRNLGEPARSAPPTAPAELMADRAAFKSRPGMAQAEGAVARDASAQSSFALPSQMIIRTGQVVIEVDSLDRAIRMVGEAALASGGFLANTSIQTGQNAPRTATLEVKVPADRYQGTVDRLNAIGKVTSATTTAQDVGEEFVDVSARVSNAKKLEDRLLTLLATRTGKLEDVLSVERELARVREEIERYEGRIRYLKAQVAISTITITVFEPGPLVGGPGENVLVRAFKESWRNFVGVIASGIALAGGLIPLVLLGIVVLVVLRAVWRRFGRASAGVTGS